MIRKCKKCGSEENYNFAINNGLCDSCIGEEFEQLQADLKVVSEAYLAKCRNKWVNIKVTRKAIKVAKQALKKKGSE